MPSFRRGAVVLSLALGMVVGSACGAVEERTARLPVSSLPRSAKPHRPVSPRPPSTAAPDVRGALAALSAVIGRMFPPPTAPPVTAPSTTVPVDTQMSATVYPASFQPCGGEYPPCSTVAGESGGDYGAINPGGCGGAGCYGKWQFSGEWACRLGLPCDLRTATPAQQDDAARLLWNGGAGCSNWDAC